MENFEDKINGNGEALPPDEACETPESVEMTETVETPGEGAPVDRVPIAEAPTAEEPTAGAPVEEPSAAEPAANLPPQGAYGPSMAPPLDWRYGGCIPTQEAPRRSGLAGFFAIFGAVLAVCVLLLLVVTLFVGDGGCQFTEHVTYERVVYVREDGTVVGKYAPGEVVDLMSESTVTVVVKGATVSGFGSGFVYSEDGYIITNHHVINAEAEVDVQVMLSDGKVYDAAVVGSNAAADVAVLKIEAEGLKPVKIGNSAMALVGESVVAIGTPVELDYQGTATFGRISATSRIVTFNDAQGNITKRMYVLQTDTSVNPGNSGGPLVNMDGEVVGVVVMKIAGSGQDYYEGLGFALPINGVVEIADEIIEKGSFTGVNPIAKGRLLLGITGHTVSEGYWYDIHEDGTIDASMSEKEGFVEMPASGVHVISTSAGSGAAGLVEYGDIIIKADGLRVLSIDDLIGAVNRRESGYGVTLTVLRDGVERTVVINLSEEPLQ